MSGQIQPGWHPDPWDAARERWWNGDAWSEHLRASTAPPMPANAVVDGQRARPVARLIRTPTDGEEVAAEWMRWFGFADAYATQASRDGGIDVDSSTAVAQVKMQRTPVGRPVLQQLSGVAQVMGKQALCFSLMHYTRDAEQWAGRTGIALFRFNEAGEAEAINDLARTLLAHAGRHGEAHPVASMHRPQPQPPAARAGLRIALPDHSFIQSAGNSCKGMVSKEQVAWLTQGWLYLFAIELDYTVQERRGTVGHSALLFSDSLGGSLYRPAHQVTSIGLPENTPHIIGGYEPADLIKQVMKDYRALGRVSRPETVQRYSQALRQYGVPPAATSISMRDAPGTLLPVVVAGIELKGQTRILVWDAATGIISDPLIYAFSQTMRWSVSELMRTGRRLL